MISCVDCRLSPECVDARCFTCECSRFEPCKSVQHSVVNHPAHYTVGKYEAIEIIEDWNLGYHLGNAVKYICRAPYKGHEVEDLRKANFYIERYITLLENRGK